MNFFVNKKALKGLNYLDLTPFRINEFEEENGVVTILIKKFKSRFMQSFLPRHRTNFIKIHLDEVGSLVWMNIDGTRTVGQIVDSIALNQGESLPQPMERTTKFMTQLFRQKFIGFRELEK